MSRAHRIVAGFFLVSSTGALSLIDRMIYGAWSGKGGDKFTEAVNLAAIVASILLFWWGAQRPRGPRLNQVLPLAAAGLLVSSVVWSVEPTVTLTRSVAYLFLVVAAIGIVRTLRPDEVMGLTASISGVSAAISLLLFFVLPGAVIIDHDFTGVFPHKNELGQAMMVGVLAGLHGIRTGSGQRFRNAAVTALCTLVAFLSKSTTSLVTIFVFFILHIIATLYIKGGYRRAISIFLTITVVPICIFLLMNKDLIFSFFEKDPTLTGRTDLWPYVINYIYERPVLGWGFTGFWGPSNPRLLEISSALGWYVTEAHNGILQLLLDVGFVGTALFLFLWMRNFVIAVRCMNGPGPEIGVSSLLLMLGILLTGVSEQVLVTVDGPTVQFFLLGFMCEQSLRSYTNRELPSWLGHRGRQWSGPIGASRIHDAATRHRVVARRSIN